MIVNIVIVAVLALIALGGIRTLIKNAHGESCCSGGNTEVPVKPVDRNKKIYARLIGLHRFLKWCFINIRRSCILDVDSSVLQNFSDGKGES